MKPKDAQSTLTEPCHGGACCPVKQRCGLYAKGADALHGYMDSDEGWVCEEYQERETQGELEIW